MVSIRVLSRWLAVLILFALASCQSGTTGPPSDDTSIAAYPTVDGVPAIELDGGKVVLLDPFEIGQALRDQFPPPDESAPPAIERLEIFPQSVDLRGNQTPIRDQGGRGTCVAFATAAAIEAAYHRERGVNLDLSEQFANHIQKMTALPNDNRSTFERETQPGSSGGSGVGYQLGWLFRLRFGLPPESAMAGIVAADPALTYIPWGNYENSSQPGDVPRFDFDERDVGQEEVDRWNLNPDPTPYQIPESVTLTNLPRNALEEAVYGVSRVREINPVTLAAIKTELAAGREVAFGVGLSRVDPCQVCEDGSCTPLPPGDMCYDRQDRERDEEFEGGVWNPLPTDWGGHAMLIVGYDDATRTLIVKNSWGRNAAGKGRPIGADDDADGFIEMSYDWLPRIYEAYSVLETRNASAWSPTNPQWAIGDWNAEFDVWVERADIAAYHIPGAFPASALGGQTDRRIGTLYSDTAGAFRVNGSITTSTTMRHMLGYFGSNPINDSYDETSPGYAISSYLFTEDPATMAGWVTDPFTSEVTPFYASLDDYPVMEPARASAGSVVASDYLGRWLLSDDGVEGVLDLTGTSGGATVTGAFENASEVVPGVTLVLDGSDPCRFDLTIPFAGGARTFGGGLFCDTSAPSQRALMAGTRPDGAQVRGFFAYRSGTVPISIEITRPADGASYPRGSTQVEFRADAESADTIDWTSSIDGSIGTGASFDRLDLSVGDHVITATASNGLGETATDSIDLTITNDPPVVEIFEPDTGAGPFCTDEPIGFQATVTDINEPFAYTLPDSAVAWRVAGGGDLGVGKSIETSFATAGGRTVVVRATDPQGAFDEDSLNLEIVECVNEPPSVLITEPSADTGTNDADFVYDGFDDGLGLWYADVSLAGAATDPEDGTLSGASLAWTTNRTDIQAVSLGTGTGLTARLYSDVCTGTWHEVVLTATDGAGVSRSAVRRIFIWTLC